MFTERRFFYFTLVPAIILALIAARLFYLQVVRGNYYLQRSQSNFIQERPLPHNRGLIVDQAGVPMVDNRPAHDLYVTFAMLPSSLKTIKGLATVIGMSQKDARTFHDQLVPHIEAGRTEPVALATLKSDNACNRAVDFVTREQITGIEITPGDPSGCQVWVRPDGIPSQRHAFKLLQEALGVADQDMQSYIAAAQKKAVGLGQFKPVLFLSDLDFDAYARVSSAVSLGMLSGVALFDSVKRRYIYGSFAAHALGYLNEISPQELKKRGGDYRLGDRVGRKGLEVVYEDVLRGKDGAERFVVDARGRRFEDEWESQLLGDARVDRPIAGNTLVLSIDAQIQKSIEDAFMGKAGSVVAIEAGTGFVLGMASFPAYNANDIIARDNRALMAKLSSDRLKPWMNKAVQEHYAPGSTFKAVTAVAGLENELVQVNTIENCTGAFHLGKSTWRCFNRKGHGPIKMDEALKTSCDVYFYNLGYLLGTERLADTAKLLGFGRKTGIDLDTEIAGLIPDKAYYQKRYGFNAPGFAVNNAIGQGEVTVTPLQLAIAYDAMVNGGTIYRPQLVREIRNSEGKLLKTHRPIEVAHLTENKKDLDVVRKSLAHVLEPGGTAYGVMFRSDLQPLAKWLRESKVAIGGKTGTAQVVKLAKTIQHLRPEEVEYALRDHAWFVGFAPVEKPEIIVVAMTEHGGFGGTASAPVVLEAIKTWFEKVRGVGRYASFGVLDATRPQ